MFGLGPIYLFLITNRFNRKDARKKERINTYVTNISIIAFIYIVMFGDWLASISIDSTSNLVCGRHARNMVILCATSV